MKKKIFFLLIMQCALSKVNSQNQGINNNWILGYGSWAGYPFGNPKMNFYNGSLIMTNDSLAMSFAVSHTNISDTLGNILFYTNGIYVADATNDTMLNGSGLNTSQYTTLYKDDGLYIPQAELIIQKPDSPNIYYMFHCTVDNSNDVYSLYLYISTIDMSKNSGKGEVIYKNNILFSDTLNVGRITACRHGNGRDWWIFCHKAYSNIFYSLLVTPYGIFGPYQQSIGIIRPPDYGQCVFSPNGQRMAYYETANDLEIFNFDRCSGLLSNPRYVSINDSALGGGCAFSPNSNVLYVPSSRYVYQFDATAANLATSQITVAVWDSFLSPIPGFPSLPTYFNLSALAPDGKIYVTTGNGTLHMHVINFPDSIGTTCGMVQHGITMPSLYFNTLPNHPNYFLGRDTTSMCDSLTGVIEYQMAEKVPKVMPNPTTGKITLWFAVHDKPGWAEIYSTSGKCIRKETVAQWSQYKQMDISKEPQGVYLCRMHWGEKNVSVKIIKE